MKICLFSSGYVRTLFYGFHKNIELIKSTLPDCKIDICYSFWDQNHLSDRINDPWHSKIENYNVQFAEKNKIDQYLFDIGFNNVKGEIEDFSISEKIISESNFPENKKRLSSQYYKIYNVASKYFSDEYDLYLTIRPDAILQRFLSKNEIINLNLRNGIVVNQNYWYNALYRGKDCNEYVWASNKNTFVPSNSQFLYLNDLINQVPDYYGEIITGQHFNNLLSSKKISNIGIFNFDYRVIR